MAYRYGSDRICYLLPNGSTYGGDPIWKRIVPVSNRSHVNRVNPSTTVDPIPCKRGLCSSKTAHCLAKSWLKQMNQTGHPFTQRTCSKWCYRSGMYMLRYHGNLNCERGGGGGRFKSVWKRNLLYFWATLTETWGRDTKRDLEQWSFLCLDLLIYALTFPNFFYFGGNSYFELIFLC